MLFNSLGFLFVFLPLVLAVSKQLRGRPLLAWITITSFVFYAFAGHAWFLVPMLFTTVLDFLLAPRISQAGSLGGKRALLAISLLGNLGLLVYFKYSGLIARSIVAVASLIHPQTSINHSRWLELFDVTLPAGISFYTFQTMSYVIDVYRGQCEPERDFWRFAGFVSFFPHLVAGPLTRHHQLIPALKRIAHDGVKPQWQAGVMLFSIGLAKKVLIADRIANLIDSRIQNIASADMLTAWLSLIGYSLQIYFDFSGYSDMALGLGRLFDIRLPLNFNSPYQATNPTDFWRRWHITLSNWLRDYLYISLGGNRRGELRRNVNLMITMVLGGLWHGANYTFIIWGFYHGTLLIVYHQLRGSWDRLSGLAQKSLTFFLVTLGWLPFRAHSIEQMRAWVASLFRWQRPELGADGRWLIVLMAGGLMIAWWAPNAATNEELPRWGARRQVGLAALTVVSIVLMNYSSRFLYFQF